jgi:hypothetical protein
VYARPSPFTTFTIAYKVVMYAPTERASRLSLFHLYPGCYKEMSSILAGNIALVYEPKCGGRGGGVQVYTGAQINFGDLSFNLCLCPSLLCGIDHFQVSGSVAARCDVQHCGQPHLRQHSLRPGGRVSLSLLDPHLSHRLRLLRSADQ